LTLLGASLQSLHMLLTPETHGLVRGTPEFERAILRAVGDLLTEARLLQSLRHPNIVLFHGVAMHPEHGHVQWLVTELANGGSLEAWVAARGCMTLEELLDLLRSVMRALVYLHSRTPAVIHRDVKPANVLVFTLDSGVTWKLADVGIAKVLQSTQHARTDTGTRFYMARDVLDGAYDSKVDVFSTGIMAAELVVRYVNIPGFERVDAAMYRDLQHRTALVEDACARLDTVSPALSAVVRGCSAVKAKHRMSSDAALRALDEIDGRSALMDGLYCGTAWCLVWRSRAGLLAQCIRRCSTERGCAPRCVMAAYRVALHRRVLLLPAVSLAPCKCTLSLAVCCV
jgi:serine/threonine protein kinase